MRSMKPLYRTAFALQRPPASLEVVLRRENKLTTTIKAV